MITENKFSIVPLNEYTYNLRLPYLIQLIEKSNSKICYICINKPFEMLVEDFRKKSINLNHFYFIDVLSSHYIQKKEVKNCIFLEEPINLVKIQDNIHEVVKKKKCDAVIFDTICSLLNYASVYSITKFAHKLIIEDPYKTNKLFIVIKDTDILKNDIKPLINDLKMFADKTIELN